MLGLGFLLVTFFSTFSKVLRPYVNRVGFLGCLPDLVLGVVAVKLAELSSSLCGLLHFLKVDCLKLWATCIGHLWGALGRPSQTRV